MLCQHSYFTPWHGYYCTCCTKLPDTLAGTGTLNETTSYKPFLYADMSRPAVFIGLDENNTTVESKAAVAHTVHVTSLYFVLCIKWVRLRRTPTRDTAYYVYVLRAVFPPLLAGGEAAKDSQARTRARSATPPPAASAKRCGRRGHSSSHFRTSALRAWYVLYFVQSTVQRTYFRTP
jgi:hypothetical protein